MIIKIYADSKGLGRCRSCGAPIEWAETVAKRRMPFDPPIVAVRMQGSVLGEGEGRVVEEVDTAITSSHFVTCPQGREWSRRNGGRRH